MSEEEHITVTCQNCGEEITNSRAATSSSATGSVLIAAVASFPQTNRSSLVSNLWLDYDYEHEFFIRLPRRYVVKAGASSFPFL
jgi:hypothetical protein